MFIVYYNAGHWEDIYNVNIFVTFDEQKAINYVNKFNRLLAKWKDYYNDNYDKIDDDSTTYYVINILDVNSALYKKVELR
jgi:hypothetical protein